VRGFLDNIYHRCKKVNGCLLWQGALDDSGYGIVRRGNKVRPVHHIVYTEETGIKVTNYYIKHSCGHRNCVTVSHMIVKHDRE
jgi:hypothetical protein